METICIVHSGQYVNDCRALAPVCTFCSVGTARRNGCQCLLFSVFVLSLWLPLGWWEPRSVCMKTMWAHVHLLPPAGGLALAEEMRGRGAKVLLAADSSGQQFVIKWMQVQVGRQFECGSSLSCTA